jgi:hypothetical protein
MLTILITEDDHNHILAIATQELIELLNVLKFVLIIFISLSYFKSQNYMKVMRKNLIGIANLHISTIVLLNAGTVPTV